MRFKVKCFIFVSFNNAKLIIMDLEMLELFQKKLNTDPPKSAIEKDKRQGFSYLPISYYEIMLDDIYFGQWTTTDIQTKIVANEIIVSLQLNVLHPISGVWLSRSGCGSSTIMQNSGASVTDISQKKKNALQKDYPKAKSEALKNAAKSLGKIFGRDIGRNADTVHQDKGFVDGAKLQLIAQQNKTLNINGAKKA